MLVIEESRKSKPLRAVQVCVQEKNFVAAE